MGYVRSPIPYMGNKFKLLPYLIPIFPKNIDTFYDLFGGSGVVSANAFAKKVVYNELNVNIYNLYKLFIETEPYNVIQKIDNIVNKYHLPRYGIDVRRNLSPELVDDAEKSYLKLRDDYNKSDDRDIVMLYTLIMYSFSNLIRFNSDSDFNMPVGNQYWSQFWSNTIKRFHTNIQNKEIKLLNESSFDILEQVEFNKDDFIYLDPPYSNSDAVYNEQRAFGGWTIDDDYKLFNYLDKLTQKGVKWGLSNVYTIKGKVNQHLIDWVEKNNYSCMYIDFKYYALGRGDAQNQEVYICNYKIPIIKEEKLW